MSAAATFRAEAAKRILVKDGAYGTLIQAEKLDGCTYGGDLGLSRDQRGNNDLSTSRAPGWSRRFASASRTLAPICWQPTPSTPMPSARPIMAPSAEWPT